MTKEEIIDNIARLNSETWRDREDVRAKIGKLLAELKKALERPTSDDCVSRANLLKLYEDRFIELQKAQQKEKQLGVNWCINTLKELPPVIPTHGTCKDCTAWDKEYHFCSMLDCDTGSEFYCKDFNKRGSGE